MNALLFFWCEPWKSQLEIKLIETSMGVMAWGLTYFKSLHTIKQSNDFGTHQQVQLCKLKPHPISSTMIFFKAVSIL